MFKKDDIIKLLLYSDYTIFEYAEDYEFKKATLLYDTEGMSYKAIFGFFSAGGQDAALDPDRDMDETRSIVIKFFDRFTGEEIDGLKEFGVSEESKRSIHSVLIFHLSGFLFAKILSIF